MQAMDMPISDSQATSEYSGALTAFIAEQVPARGAGGVLQAYNAVRQMPYFSGADRTPLAALRSGRGACTAKHIILRDALRATGQRADVEIVRGDFAAAIPLHPSQGADLADMIRRGGVIDYHCRVVLRDVDGDRRLDATWPDGLASYGFTVNRGWTGQGDTLQAMPDAVHCATPEDVLATKVEMLATLDPAMIKMRLEFLRLLSGWMAELQMTETSGRA
jgi:hypothetical protein